MNNICVIDDRSSLSLDLPHLFDPWKIGSTVITSLDDKLSWLKNNDGFSFQLNVNDYINMASICLLLENTTTIRIHSGTNNNIDINLKYLSLVDEIIDISVPTQYTKTDHAIFSPGRSGSHYYRKILESRHGTPISLYHHNSETMANKDNLLSTNYLHLLFRRNPIDHISSYVIADKYGFVVYNSDEIKKQLDDLKSWTPAIATRDRVYHYMESRMHFANAAIYIMMCDKTSDLVFFEDLDVALDFGIYKSPYEKINLIDNYDAMTGWINDVVTLDSIVVDNLSKRHDCYRKCDAADITFVLEDLKRIHKRKRSRISCPSSSE